MKNNVLFREVYFRSYIFALKSPIFFPSTFLFVENGCGGKSKSYRKNDHGEMTTKSTFLCLVVVAIKQYGRFQHYQIPMLTLLFS